MIKIISIGKKTDYDSQISSYLKRLRAPYDVEFCLLNFSSESNEMARKMESDKIRENIKPNDYVILLDERGIEIDNYDLSKRLVSYKSVVIIIGGPYGVDEELRKRANFIWCLGKLILPYEIVRLILVEQIYRSQAIATSHPYHHK